MSLLNPREKFLEDAVAVRRYREFVDDPVIQSAIQGVLIEFMRRNPSQEATRGANDFVQVFLTYTEKPTPFKPWPNHGTLTHPQDAYERIPQIQKKK